MARPPKPFHLKAQDQKTLKQMLSGGVQQVRVVLRALALLQLNAGLSAPKVSQTVGFAAQAIRTIAKRYREGGLERSLYEKQRPGAAEVSAFRYRVIRLWRSILIHRSQKRNLTWARMRKLADRWIPQPRVLHPYPRVRFDAMHPR